MTDEKPKQAKAQTSHRSRLVLQIILLVVLFAALAIGYNLIKTPALRITESSLEKQTATFLMISTLKSSLGIIEGSDVGIGFRLEVGDIIQSTYDLVDFTWKIILYGIIIVTFCKILFESNMMNIGVVILGAGFVFVILSLLIHKYRKTLLTLGSGTIIAGVIIAFYIPVAAMVSLHTSEFFVSHIEKDLDAQMRDVSQQWEKYKKSFDLAKLKSSVASSGQFIKTLFVRLTGILITYTCLLLIKYLFFPLIVAYGFILVTKTFFTRFITQP